MKKPALVLAFRGTPKRQRLDRLPAIVRKAARLASVCPHDAALVERLIDDFLAETNEYERA